MIQTYYDLFVGLSAVMMLFFVLQWRKNASFEYMFTFALVPVVNLGYAWLARSVNLEQAIIAQKITYLGGCFLHLFLFMGIVSLCNIRLKPWIKTLMLFVAFLMYGCVLTMDRGSLFYRNVGFEFVDGMGHLVKEYGPLHTVFYVYMVLIMVASVAALIYAMRFRPETSIRNLYVLIVLDVISVTAFFGGRAIGKSLGVDIEVMPAFYVAAEAIFIILFHRIRLYDVSSGIAETLLEEGDDGIICFDLTRHFLVGNKTAKKIIPSLATAKADSLLDPEKPEYRQILDCLNFFSNSEIVTDPYELNVGDRIYEIVPNNMYEGDRKVGYYLLLIDVTKDRHYNQRLKEAADAAIAAEKAKGSFLAQMSHEIRTPINAVLGMNEMILREAKDNDIIDYAESIQSAGKTLLLLINSILDFSKIESGKMEIVPVRYSTVEMIRSCLMSIMPRASAKRLSVIKDIDEGLPRELFGDDVRVSQIIVNLLTNAVKYTEKGSITLSIKGGRRIEGKIELLVSVKDTGIGIKEEEMPKLFESFGRAELKRNRNIEGTGLGMSIVTGLLDMMDSKLEVKSVYGEGSEFSFCLLQEIYDERTIGYVNIESEKKKAARPDVVQIPGKEILVVDDNQMNLKVASRFLKLSGVEADTALSGMEALEMVSKKKYDMIFLDHMMPKMDGIETLSEMWKKRLIGEDTVVIALTANAIMGAKETYLEAGFDDYMSKPIDIKNLDELLRKYFTGEKNGA